MVAVNDFPVLGPGPDDQPRHEFSGPYDPRRWPVVKTPEQAERIVGRCLEQMDVTFVGGDSAYWSWDPAIVCPVCREPVTGYQWRTGEDAVLGPCGDRVSYEVAVALR